MRTWYSALLFVGLLVQSMLTLAGNVSFSNLRIIADPAGGPGLVARFTYYCGDRVWDGEVVAITRSGSNVTVVLSDSSDLICLGLPPPPADQDIALGALPAGDYQLSIQQAPIAPSTTPTLLLSRSFSVAAVGPYTNLRVLPTPAFAFTPVSARLLWTCGAGYATAPPRISRSGNRLEVRIPVVLDACFAGLPPPPQDQDLSLGQLPPGAYTLVVQQDPNPESLVVPAQSVSFVVQAGGGAQSVPSLGVFGLLLLAFALVLFGGFSVRALRLPSTR